MGRALLAFVALFAACDAGTVAEPERRPGASGASSSVASAPKPELVPVPAGAKDGRAWVKSELARAAKDDVKLVIYVGAGWCEPCRRFHDAVKAGQLDRDLAGVRFLELDHDAHEALLGPGDLACSSELVPLFVRPNEDGTCGARRTEGGIKGDGAVGFILPKLKAIL